MTTDNEIEEQEKPSKGAPLTEDERAALAKRIYAIRLLNPNVPSVAIAKELNISRFQVARLIDSSHYKNAIEELGGADVTALVTQAKKKLSKLLHESVRVIEHHLSKNSLDAAKMVLRSQGLEQMEEKQGDTAITVVLPNGIKTAQVIEVKEDGSPTKG